MNNLRDRVKYTWFFKGKDTDYDYDKHSCLICGESSKVFMRVNAMNYYDDYFYLCKYCCNMIKDQVG
ncbi:MAG: hypothetical protein R3321_13530 [Nitrososphaeraceae archaeon]|nr:hypothetical protein [Nitrososphaeraceae archaeon]